MPEWLGAVANKVKPQKLFVSAVLSVSLTLSLNEIILAKPFFLDTNRKCFYKMPIFGGYRVSFRHMLDGFRSDTTEWYREIELRIGTDKVNL